MNFTIAGIPLTGNLTACQRLEYLDLMSVGSILVCLAIAPFLIVAFSVWLLPCLYRGDCGCIPGMMCESCIAAEEDEQNSQSDGDVAHGKND